MYTIATIDHQKRRIMTTVDGFITPADFLALGVDTRAAVRSLGLAGSAPHDLLYDLSSAKIGSRDTIAEIGTIMRNPMYKHLWARNIAFVTPSALLRLQMERLVAGRPGLEVFDDLASAQCWLDLADAAGPGRHDPANSTAD